MNEVIIKNHKLRSAEQTSCDVTHKFQTVIYTIWNKIKKIINLIHLLILNIHLNKEIFFIPKVL